MNFKEMKLHHMPYDYAILSDGALLVDKTSCVLFASVIDDAKLKRLCEPVYEGR